VLIKSDRLPFGMRQLLSMGVVLALLLTATFRQDPWLALSVYLLALTIGRLLDVGFEKLLMLSFGFPSYLDFGVLLNFSPAILICCLLWCRPVFWRRLRASDDTRVLAKWLACVIVILWAYFAAVLLLRGEIGDWQPVAKIVVTGLICFTVAIVVSEAAGSGKRELLNVWILAASFLSLATLVAYVSQLSGATWFSNGLVFLGWRASGTFTDPNLFALYLLISLGFAITNLLQRLSPQLGAAVLLISIMLALANSRAASLALVGMLTIGLVLLLGKWRLWFTWLAIAGVVSISVLGTNIVDSLGPKSVSFQEVQILDLSVSTTARTSVQGDIRFEFWSAGVEMWRADPFFGAGLGQFSEVSRDAQMWKWGSGSLHNTFVTLLVEGGALGLFLIVAALAVLITKLALTRNPQGVGLAATVTSVVIFMNGFDLIHASLVWGCLGAATGFLSSGGGKARHITTTAS
jgi:O-antigen ligase